VSTCPRDVPSAGLVRARRFRRIGLAALAVFVLAGLLNLVGVRLDTVAAAAEGYRLSVEYARVTRPGLATTWTVAIARDGGFDRPITITTNADYFERFDFNEFYPEPASMASRGDRLLLTFEGIEGERFVLRFDGRTTPAYVFDLAQGSTGLEVGDREVVHVDYTTVVMP
jgi:hypothetical protein